MDRIFTPVFFTALLFCLLFSEVRSQNIYPPEGVNWVSANQNPTRYAQPVNGTPNDYRVLHYRKVSTTIPNPTDGRGQWFTTINAQPSGGNIFNTSMTGGGGNGFLFTSGPAGNQFQNKWNFLGVGQATLNTINNVQHSNGSGEDMGLNMSVSGHYTFVLKDAGYNSSGFYVGYTNASPVTFIVKETVVNPGRSATITITLSSAPSSQERFYARYSTTNNNDFSTAASLITDAGTISGNEVVITIPPIAANTTVYYYVFSSTLFKTPLQSLAEGNKSYALLHFQDNGGANYTYSTSATSTATDYFRSNVASGNWNNIASWQSSPDGSNWNAATIAPGPNAKGVHIRSGNVIDITAAVMIDKTVVDGTLRLLDNGFTLADGIGADELTINSGGVLQCIFSTATRIYANHIFYGSNGNINVNSGGKIMIGDGTSEHNAPGYSGFATEPATKVKWNDGAVFEWNTSGANFTAGQVYFPDALVSDKSIFRVSQVLTTTNPGSGNASPLTFNGIFEVLIDFTLEGSGPKNFRDGIIGTSTLTLLTGSGTVTFTGSTPILGGPDLKINTQKQLNLNSGMTVPAGANVKIISTSSVEKGAGGILIVEGTLDITDVAISNTSGSILINGTLKTSKLNGLYNPGNIASGTFIIGNGSTIEYYADAPQLISTSVNYYNITFKGGLKTFSSAASVNVHTLGTVTISGPDVIVDASTNNLGLTTPNTTNFNMDGGRLIVGTTGTQPNMGGVYNITGGVIQFVNNSITDQTIRSPRTYQNIEIFGRNVDNSSGIITLNSNGSFKVKTGGIFTINDESIKAADATSGQQITVETGAVFRTGNNGGFIGSDGSSSVHSAIHNNIPNANIVLQANSTVEFIRNGDQTNRSGGITYSNLKISGSGHKFFHGVVSVNDSLSNTSNFTLNSSTKGFLYLGGSSDQTISGSGNFYLHTMEVANANTIFLKSNINQVDDHLTLTNGKLDVFPGASIQLGNNAGLTASAGDFAEASQGDITFDGNSNVNGTVNFYPHVYINNAGVNFGSQSYIHRLLQINSGGFLNINAPTYSANSLLKYNSEGNYDRRVEWSAASGKGYPYHVQISNNTILNPAGNAGYDTEEFVAAGNVTIDAGSALYMDYAGHNMKVPLEIEGHLFINGSLSGSQEIGGDIKLKGDWTRGAGGAYYPNQRAVFFMGDQHSHITAPGRETFDYLFLQKQNSVPELRLIDSITITREFGIAAGTFVLNNRDATLRSNATATASMNEMDGNAILDYNGSGRFIVERYIPLHNKAWQFLSVPTKGSTINQSWQEGATAVNPNPKPGYGINITDSNSNWQTSGFDGFSQGGPSMKYYEPLNNSYIGVSATNIPIANPNGYFVFVRGDRSVSLINQPATATTLRTRGKLYAPGTEAPPVINVPPNQFASVGNPYASAINFADLGLSNISSSYIIWDPQLTTSPSAFGYGAFRTISGNFAVPSSGNYVEGNIPPIQSGQAFYIQTTANPGAISFAENAKVKGTSHIFREANTIQDPDARLRVNMYALPGNVSVLIDGTLSLFHPEYAANMNEWDARKVMNPAENIGIAHPSAILSIERRLMPAPNDTLFYTMNNLKKNNYEFEIIPAKWHSTGLQAYLEDRYLGSKTALPIDSSSRISFAVNNEIASGAENRFFITFKELGVLPVTITNINAYLENNDVVVKWEVENEQQIVSYMVESGRDGFQFNERKTIKATNGHSYHWIDEQPEPGYHYYRLKIIEMNGKISYSRVVKIFIGTEIASVGIYPNPVVHGNIHLRLNHLAPGKYHARLINYAGQILHEHSFIYSGNYQTEIIHTGKNVTHGLYHLELINPGDVIKRLEIVY